MTRLHMATWRIWCLFACVGSWAAFSQTSSPGVGIRLDQYHAAELATDGFSISRPIDLGHMHFAAQMQFDYALEPLVIENQTGTSSVINRVVQHQLVGHLGFALGLWNRWILFAGMPLSLVQKGDQVAGLPQNDGSFSLGDPRFGVRGRLYGRNDDAFTLAAQLGMSLALAETVHPEQRYSGDRSIVIDPQLLAELRVSPRLRFGAALGARIRPKMSALENLRVGSEWTAALGATVSVKPERWDLTAELFGATGFADFSHSDVSPFFQRATSPMELLVGTKVHFNESWTAGFSVGPGLTHGYGSPLIRAVAMVGYVPRLRSDPSPDSDGDGILDVNDECPNVRGTAEMKGCPAKDVDTDHDGISDKDDLCPTEPGPKIRRGCPIKDLDGDGVEDAEDICPKDPGPASNHGCPEVVNKPKKHHSK